MSDFIINQINSQLFTAMVKTGLIQDGQFVRPAVYQSSGYMDLHIEDIGNYRDLLGRSIKVYSLAHYYKQNGDMMRDPDVEFGVNFEKQAVFPLLYRNDGVGFIQDVFDDNDNLVLRIEKSIGEFLLLFVNNIKDQGFLQSVPKESAA